MIQPCQPDIYDQAAAAVSAAMGVPVKVTSEDKLRGDVIEALYWIRSGAPHKAMETLENALKRKPTTHK